jgi:hypothetical protein
MEAMTAAAIAALTIYDMTKAVERGIAIESIRLLEKRGGKSGPWLGGRLAEMHRTSPAYRTAVVILSDRAAERRAARRLHSRGRARCSARRLRSSVRA